MINYNLVSFVFVSDMTFFIKNNKSGLYLGVEEIFADTALKLYEKDTAIANCQIFKIF